MDSCPNSFEVGTKERRINPTASAPPPPGQFGTAGRNILRVREVFQKTEIQVLLVRFHGARPSVSRVKSRNEVGAGAGKRRAQDWLH